VVFNGQVTLVSLVECVFSGFQFINVPGISIRWDGNSRRCIERNIYFQDCIGSANDAQDHNPYTGDTSSLKFYMCTFDSLTLFRSGMVLMGSWGDAAAGICYMDSVVFSRIKVDSTLSNGTEVRGVFFRLDAHDWRVVYKGTNTVTGDVGIFYIVGSGSIHNIYRFGGRGYILRIWNVGLKTVGNTYFYNNIDLNSVVYGTLDTRVDPTQFTTYVTGGNCYIFNNTSGNKSDNIGYWASLAVVGTYAPPYVCQTRNNLGFNLLTRGKPPITANQSSNTWISDSSNNMYFDVPDGVVDPITCVPLANSPVIGKGLTLPLVQDDYYHNPRLGAYDIGAVQHGGAIIPPPPNQPPVAIAGAAQTITLPVSNIQLDGSKSYDPDGTISSYAWSMVSGSGGVITSDSSSITTVTGLTKGLYIFKLTVTDNDSASSSTLDTIQVNPAANLPPIANAGADQTLTLPVSSTTVDGSASKDPNVGGAIASYQWSQGSGPATATITSADSAATTISGLQPGVYVFNLKVTDSLGASATDSLRIIVQDSSSSGTNIPPIANAGPSMTIFLPANQATLDGSKSSDPDGSIVSYSWTRISGPSIPGSSGDSTAILSLTGLVAGQYIYQLSVTDNGGATSSAQVKITVVAAPNVPPIANAGPNQTITAPTSTVNLNGSASYDPDGSLVGYTWVMISGQGSVTITNGNTANPGVSGLKTGVYIFQLTVTDNGGATASGQITVTVNPEPTLPNQAPVANAGSNQVISLPTNTIVLNGSSSFDPDGTIAHYAWNEISGPSTATITNINTATPTVSGLIEGAYTFQLMVTDNNGASSFDQVTITVNPTVNKIHQPPVAIAGKDTTIYLPTSSFLLNASASYDPDGNITAYQWQQISGPNTAIASTMNSAQVDLSNLQPGTYQFQLTVTDNQGASSTASVKISVDKNSGSPDQFTVYPNPALDVLTARINTPVSGTVRMIVYDMNGRTVMTGEVEKTVDLFEKTLNVSSLASGMYTIQVIIANRKILVTKFIKK
jgi:hypothetical protein